MKTILSEQEWVDLAICMNLPSLAGFYAWTIAEGTSQGQGKQFLNWLKDVTQ